MVDNIKWENSVWYLCTRGWIMHCGPGKHTLCTESVLCSCPQNLANFQRSLAAVRSTSFLPLSLYWSYFVHKPLWSADYSYHHQSAQQCITSRPLTPFLNTSIVFILWIYQANSIQSKELRCRTLSPTHCMEILKVLTFTSWGLIIKHLDESIIMC